MNVNDIKELMEENKIYSSGIHSEMLKRHYPHVNADKVDKKRFLVHDYRTGGYSGGNCWDDTQPEYYEEKVSKKDKEFGVLDKLLKVVAPNITYLEYKGLSDIIIEDSYTEGEYYGNSSEYTVIMIDLEDLIKELEL